MASDHILHQQISFMKQTFECISFSEDHYRMHFTLHPGGSIPPHRHPHMDELFEITEGAALFTHQGKETRKSAGEQLLIPKGETHAIRNTGQTPMQCTVTYSPGSDTHRMFAIYTDLWNRGYREWKLMMKGEYLCQAAGLATFAESAGFLLVVERAIQLILRPIGWAKGWNKEAARYRA